MNEEELKDAAKTLKGFDKNALYQKEIFTDGVSGEITMLTPVLPGGGRDVKRPTRWFSSVMLMMNGQQMAVNFEIMASGIEDACDKYTASATEAANKAMAQIVENQRKILIPQTAAAHMKMQ